MLVDFQLSQRSHARARAAGGYCPLHGLTDVWQLDPYVMQVIGAGQILAVELLQFTLELRLDAQAQYTEHQRKQ
ncbi:hypothetical protein D3C76_1100850 [compost metagenome]